MKSACLGNIRTTIAVPFFSTSLVSFVRAVVLAVALRDQAVCVDLCRRIEPVCCLIILSLTLRNVLKEFTFFFLICSSQNICCLCVRLIPLLLYCRVIGISFPTASRGLQPCIADVFLLVYNFLGSTVGEGHFPPPSDPNHISQPLTLVLVPKDPTEWLSAHKLCFSWPSKAKLCHMISQTQKSLCPRPRKGGDYATRRFGLIVSVPFTVS